MTRDHVAFSLAGHPQGKGRARAVRRGNFIGHYTPEKTRSYEGMLRHEATVAMAGRAPFDVPVSIVISAHFDVPASWSKAKRAAALANQSKPGKKPDLDNIVKAVVDACNRARLPLSALALSMACPTPTSTATTRPERERSTSTAASTSPMTAPLSCLPWRRRTSRLPEAGTPSR